MGNSPRQESDGLHFLRSVELLLQALALGIRTQPRTHVMHERDRDIRTAKATSHSPNFDRKDRPVFLLVAPRAERGD
jgi:hypothetical protein